ncbi:MAG TPA: 2-phosphosulfolactate phosphatase [Candidatus Paceibacterota bacterium]|nr:2-phosphosulfolactate phosphatase [Candidatus Paceibacterota bacterium]
MKLEVLFTPAEFAALASRDLRETACVVFDVLRATSTFATALHNGAKEIIPVSEISEALEIRKTRPAVLLGGERDGFRISADGIDFDLGNSPREYTPGKIRGKAIVSTTTNGTRALRACAGAKTVLAAAFLNLGATAEFLRREKFADILLVCAGTGENAALEDTLAAGALCDILSGGFGAGANSISVESARRAYAQAKSNLAGAMRDSENARRLLANSALRGDVAFCLQRDICPLVARMDANGAIRRA